MELSRGQYIKGKWVEVSPTSIITGANFKGGVTYTFPYSCAYSNRVIGSKAFLNVTDYLDVSAAAGNYHAVENISTTVDGAYRSANAGAVWNIARVNNHIPAYFSSVEMSLGTKELCNLKFPEIHDTMKKRLKYSKSYLNSLFSASNWKSRAERIADCAGSTGTTGAKKTWDWKLNDLLGPMDKILPPGQYTWKFTVDNNYNKKVLESGGKLSATVGEACTFPDDNVKLLMNDIKLYLYVVEDLSQQLAGKEIQFNFIDSEVLEQSLIGTNDTKAFQVKPTTKRLSFAMQSASTTSSFYYSSTDFNAKNALPASQATLPTNQTDLNQKLEMFLLQYAGEYYPEENWKQEEDTTKQIYSRLLYYTMNMAADKDLNQGGSSESFTEWQASRMYSFKINKRDDDVSREVNLKVLNSDMSGTNAILMSEYEKRFVITYNREGVVSSILP